MSNDPLRAPPGVNHGAAVAVPPRTAAPAAEFQHLDAKFNVILRPQDLSTSTWTRIVLPFNPNSVRSRFTADYVQHAPLGYSQGRMQYIRTACTEITFQVWYDDVLAKLQRRPDVGQVRDKLLALTSPHATGDPPRIVFLVWPNHIVARGVIPSVEIEDTMFYDDGNVRAWTADITFVEDPEAFVNAATRVAGGQNFALGSWNLASFVPNVSYRTS